MKPRVGRNDLAHAAVAESSRNVAGVNPDSGGPPAGVRVPLPSGPVPKTRAAEAKLPDD